MDEEPLLPPCVGAGETGEVDVFVSWLRPADPVDPAFEAFPTEAAPFPCVERPFEPGPGFVDVVCI